MDLVLPAKVRKIIYISLAIVGLVAGAIPVGYQAVDADVPKWYLAGAAVFAFVVAAPFTLAVLNIPREGRVVLNTVDTDQDVIPDGELEADPAVESDPAEVNQ